MSERIPRALPTLLIHLSANKLFSASSFSGSALGLSLHRLYTSATLFHRIFISASVYPSPSTSFSSPPLSSVMEIVECSVYVRLYARGCRGKGWRAAPKVPGNFHGAKLQYAASLFFCSFYLSSLFLFYWALRVASLFFASLIIRTHSYPQFLYLLRIPTYKIICRYRAFMWKNFVLKFFFFF